ncbi:hypothetical protein BGZ93_011176 [Podila epicladia]|nr:hypothetical protein BGZ93_011176 [Podila epicladia]
MPTRTQKVRTKGSQALTEALEALTINATLAEELKTNSTLTSFDFQNNSLGDNAGVALAEALKTNSTLLTLDLQRDTIGENGGMALAEALKTNLSLTTSYSLGSFIGDNGAHALAEARKIDSTLTALDFESKDLPAITGQIMYYNNEEQL